MWKYQHPDFALFLLGELQKQQQGSVFCDTLLQTEGVCVPAHSCVLAALSPVFSRILSTSPAPHAGQNRLLNLEAVRSRTLLKLVGFLYTGEIEISSQNEHEEVMAAALRLGIINLLQKKRVLVERGDGDGERSWRETGVQTEDKSEMVSEPLKTQSSTATLEMDLPTLSLFDEASSATGFNLISNIAVPSLADKTEASSYHNTKTRKRWKMDKRESQLKELTQPQNQIKLLNVDKTKLNQTGMAERRRNVSGKDFQKLLDTDKGQKSTTTEQKEAKVDQFKVKIKLRRRRGACWESHLFVSVQGESDKQPEEVKESGLQTSSCPPVVPPDQNLVTLTPPTDLPISPSDSSTNLSSDKCLHTPHHMFVSSPLDVPTLSSSPPQADESDEQIAILLEDMFMMGLNILPLMPLDRNLDEHDQLPSLQEQKDGQRDTTESACAFVQSCESKIRESEVKMIATPVGFSGQRDEEFSVVQNQSSSNIVKLQESPGQDHMNNITNLPTVERNSPPSMIEGIEGPGYPSPVDVLSSIFDDRPDFRLLQCISPLESEKGDSDVPTQDSTKSSHSQDPQMQKLPSWLSESPLKLDFPLSSMIDFSCPRIQCDLDACQNQSSPDPAEKQELKTSFLHSDLISGSSSNILQPDLSNAGEQPKQRKTRRQTFATRKTKVDEGQECQNLEKEDQVQPRISKCDVPALNARNLSGVRTRSTNANRKGVKRRRERSSPVSKKMHMLITDSQQQKCDVSLEPEVTGVVKRRRGRPAKYTKPHLSNNEKILPTSVQDDCEAKKSKTDGEIQQANEQESNTQEKGSTGTEEADVNNNSTQETKNSHLQFSDKVKGGCILDQIFHQTLPSCRSSPIIDKLQTPSLQDASFCLLKFRREKIKDENSKLMMTSSEHHKKDICAERKAETHTVINIMEDKEESENQRSPLSCDNVKCSFKDGDITTENNSSRTATVLENIDIQNKMTKDHLDQTIEMEEDIMKDIMVPVGDTDHPMSPARTNSAAFTNELIIMEGKEMDFCMNSEIQENSEALVSNECLFKVIDSKKDSQPTDVVYTQNMTNRLRNNKEMDELGIHKEVEIIEDVEIEETEDQKADEFVKENTLLGSDHVCWETTNGGDDQDGSDLELDQYVADIDNGLTPLEELNEGCNANDPSNGDLTEKNAQEICIDAPEASNFLSSNVCCEDVSKSESKEDCQLDEEDIEVDVLEDSGDSPIGLLAVRQPVTLNTEALLDQEDEVNDATEEEEEVDVTGEETE